MAEVSIDLKLIVGLGNPGTKYTETRHNAGFWFVDELAAEFRGQFRNEKKFQGMATKVAIAGQDVWILKPETFMNLSGQAVKALMSFYRFDPSQILVAHDEIDLPPGTIKLKRGGGHGGNNGLRDIINHLGTKDFLRLRIGVGHPGNKDQVSGYVLHPPSRDERVQIEDCIRDARNVTSVLADGDLERAMHQLHTNG